MATTVRRPAAVVTALTGVNAYEGARLSWNVRLRPQRVATSVTIWLNDGKADPTDYARAIFTNGVTYSAGRLLIPANVASFEAIVPTIADAKREGPETLTLAIGSKTASATIFPDPRPAALVTSMTALAAFEGGRLTYNVYVRPQKVATSATLLINDWNAVREDYGRGTFTKGVTYKWGKINIPPNVSSFQVFLPTVHDTKREANEYVTVTIGTKSATATIVNDDHTYRLSSG